MTNLRVEFVLDPFEPGLRSRCRPVADLDPPTLAARVPAGELRGGLCLVVDGTVWNAFPPVAWDPAGVDCVVDRVADGPIFLEGLVCAGEDRRPRTLYLTEMVTVAVDPRADGRVRLGGAQVMGSQRLADLDVPAEALFRACAEAAFTWLGFAERLLAERADLAGQLAIETWEGLAFRLLQLAGPDALPARAAERGRSGLD